MTLTMTMPTATDTTAPIRTILVDLGGVLTWTGTGQMHLSQPATTTTGTKTISMRRLMLTATWIQYERGLLSEPDCYEKLCSAYGISPAQLVQKVEHARANLEYDTRMLALLVRLKKQGQGRLRLVVASNLSKADHRALLARWGEEFWSVFDQVFLSSTVGHRKPSRAFFHQVLHQAKASPQETLLLDDSSENVLSALSLGMQGLVFTDVDEAERRLMNLLGDPVARGREFLANHAGQLVSRVDGEPLEENFSQLLILEALGDTSLVSLPRAPRRWNFFLGKAKYTTSEYPDDLDTNALALSTLPYELDALHGALDEMLEYLDDDGIPQTYYDLDRPRTDPIVALNVLTAFAQHGRTHQLPHALAWIQDILATRAYRVNTRYYSCPEWFLYHLGRLVRADTGVGETLAPLLRARVAERIGTAGDALALALRLCVCRELGLVNTVDSGRLREMQQVDGGWPCCAMYVMPGAKKELGNRGVVSAFAVRALSSV